MSNTTTITRERLDAHTSVTGPDDIASPPGWHVDPLEPEVLRFWDGQDWTTETQPALVPDPPAGWIHVVDPTWWEPPTDVTRDHLASWHLLAQHAQEHRENTRRRIRR